MREALLLVISIVFAVSNNILLHKFGNRGLKNTGDALLFNAGISLIWIPILLSIAKGVVILNNPTVLLFGIIYGVVSASFLLFKMEALANGSISITSLVGCSALIIPTLFGTFYWNEKFSLLKGIGLIVLLVSLFFCVSPKKSAEKPKFKWIIFCLCFFLASSATSIVFKFYGKSDVSKEIASMMVIASVVSSVLLTIIAFTYNAATHASVPKLGKTALIYLIPCALVSCLYNRINIYLSGAMDSMVFFPIFNGAVIFFASAAGFIIFKEKLSKVQVISLVTGAIAIIMLAGIADGLLNNFFGIKAINLN